jgi:2-polyprenyl-3-methyl-5-hydroxy-6-metoxy-1,4-benzoquinol methylase
MPMPLEKTNCPVCGSQMFEIEAVGQDYVYGTSQEHFTFVRCRNCGHLYLNPRPTMEAVNIIYPESYATFSGRFTGGTLIARVKSWILLSRFRYLKIHLPSGSCLLDIGCGDGEFLTTLREHYPEAGLHGLDWKFPDMMQRTLRASRITLLHGLVEQVDLGVEKYDVIIMNQIIEHLWQPAEVLDKCFRALRPGGLLAIETPNADGYDRTIFRAGSWGSYYFPRHLHLFTFESLRQFLEKHGFTVERQAHLFSPICWVYTVISVARRGGWRSRLIYGFFRDTNVVALALYIVIDLFARAWGCTTSNQKAIARKPHTFGESNDRLSQSV